MLERYEDGCLDEENPYVGFTRGDLFDSLAVTRCEDARGTYSNLAFQTLAACLEQVTGRTYGELLVDRICGPAGLAATTWHADRAQNALATGHDPAGRDISPWREALPGAGGIWSTSDDLGAFLTIGITPGGPLTPAMALTLQPFAWLTDTHAIGLAWQISKSPTGHLWRWHNGESGGFHAFVAVDPDARRGVSVLANWGRRRVNDTFPSAETVIRAFLGIG